MRCGEALWTFGSAGRPVTDRGSPNVPSYKKIGEIPSLELPQGEWVVLELELPVTMAANSTTLESLQRQAGSPRKEVSGSDALAKMVL